ncbi:MAG: hypothetical protein ACR2MG_17620 [Pyrinomonadaceae bacterium]
MKNLFLFISLLTSLMICACHLSSEAIIAEQVQTPTQTPSPEIQNKSEKKTTSVKKSGEIQMVFMGYPEVKNGKLFSEND